MAASFQKFDLSAFRYLDSASVAASAISLITMESLPAPAPPSGLKQHIFEKKTDEFEEYGQQIAALAKQYTRMDPQAMPQAHRQGNISLQLSGGEGTASFVIKNFLKPGGPNHVAGIQVDDVSNQMTMVIQNSNYQQSQ